MYIYVCIYVVNHVCRICGSRFVRDAETSGQRHVGPINDRKRKYQIPVGDISSNAVRPYERVGMLLLVVVVVVVLDVVSVNNDVVVVVVVDVPVARLVVAVVVVVVVIVVVVVRFFTYLWLFSFEIRHLPSDKACTVSFFFLLSLDLSFLFDFFFFCLFVCLFRSCLLYGKLRVWIVWIVLIP